MHGILIWDKLKCWRVFCLCTKFREMESADSNEKRKDSSYFQNHPPLLNFLSN